MRKRKYPHIEPVYLGVDNAAKRLGIPVKELRKLLDKGVLSKHKVGNKVLVRVNQLDEYSNAQTVAAQVGEQNAGQPLGILERFTDGDDAA